MDRSSLDDKAQRLATGLKDDLQDWLSAPPVKKSVLVAGHSTSITIEPQFWGVFKSLAQIKGCSVNELVTQIDKKRSINLSAAIRLYVLYYLLQQN